MSDARSDFIAEAEGHLDAHVGKPFTGTVENALRDAMRKQLARAHPGVEFDIDVCVEGEEIVVRWRERHG